MSKKSRKRKSQREAGDDNLEDVGVIIGKDLKSGQWITHFEDGSKDKCADPAVDNDYTLIND